MNYIEALGLDKDDKVTIYSKYTGEILYEGYINDKSDPLSPDELESHKNDLWVMTIQTKG